MRREAFEAFLVQDVHAPSSALPPHGSPAKHIVSVAARVEAILNLNLDRMAPTEAGAESVLDGMRALIPRHRFTLRQVSDFGAAVRAYARFLATARPASDR